MKQGCSSEYWYQSVRNVVFCCTRNAQGPFTLLRFMAEGDRQLIEAACVLTCPEYEKNVIIAMDEMHVKEDLVFDKHTGAMVGFVNIGDINQHLRQFEQSPQSTPSDVANLDTLAKSEVCPRSKSMLVIMVRVYSHAWTTLTLSCRLWSWVEMSYLTLCGRQWGDWKGKESCRYKYMYTAGRVYLPLPLCTVGTLHF